MSAWFWGSNTKTTPDSEGKSETPVTTTDVETKDEGENVPKDTTTTQGETTSSTGKKTNEQETKTTKRTEVPVENPFQVITPPSVTKSSTLQLVSKYVDPNSSETQYETVSFPILRYKMQVECGDCKTLEWVYLYDAASYLDFRDRFGSREFYCSTRFCTFLQHGNPVPFSGRVCIRTKHQCCKCDPKQVLGYIPDEGREFMGFHEPLHKMFDLQAMAEYTVKLPPALRRYSSVTAAKEFEERIALKDIKIDRPDTKHTEPDPRDAKRKAIADDERGTYFNEAGLHVNPEGIVVSELSLTPGEIKQRLDGYEFFPHFTDERLGVPRQWVKLTTTKRLVQVVKQDNNENKSGIIPV